MSLITQALSIGYTPPRKPAIVVAQGLDLCVQAGELTCLIGRNGIGKSTLMRTLAGIQKPLAGSVLLDDSNIHSLSVTEIAKKVAIVLTEPIAHSQMTGQELVALGRHPYTDWAGRLSERDMAQVEWAIDAVDAGHLAKLPISEMSDGSRQRLLIARALAQETDLILLDEPTAFLDVISRAEMMSLLSRLAKTTQRAILLSTHDLDLALRMGDVLWVMQKGLIHVGAPEDLALSGVLGDVFQSAQVRFNTHTMRFEFAGDGAPIRVMGAGLVYEITCHALIRAGFLVRDDGHMTVIIEGTDDSPVWRIGETTHHSIYALLKTIQASA
ncbi:MAG: ABC transporter ATP-binding protein [bacterium]|nr:ABC transporter ATP-binding protein [bacterium]